MTTSYPARRGDPNAKYEWRDAEGGVHHLKTDADGLVVPHTEGQRQTADAFGLPEARVPKADTKDASSGQEG